MSVSPWLLSRIVAGRENWRVEFPESHVIPPDDALAAFQATEGRDTLTWIGHMTALIRLDGVTVLTDPWLTDFATPTPPYGPRRYVPPGIAVKDMPKIDVIVLSHGHFDHLDLPTLDILPHKAGITAIVPLGLGHYFGGAGLWDGDRNGLVRLGDPEGPEVHGVAGDSLVQADAVQDQRYAMGGISPSRGAPASASISAAMRNTDPSIRKWRRPTAAFDLAIISIGAYLPREVMHGSHCIPETCLRLGMDLGAHTLLGVHWGTVRVGDDGFDDAPKGFVAAGRRAGIPDDRVWIMRIGETRVLPRPSRGAGAGSRRTPNAGGENETPQGVVHPLPGRTSGRARRLTRHDRS